MIGFQFKLESFAPHRIEAPADKAAFKNLAHAAGAIRKTAIDSIIAAEGPSAPGTPPHTHTAAIVKSGKRKGQQRRGELQRAIVFAQDKSKQEAVIGPRFSVVGTSGKAHEFGGEYKGQDYPERPFMGPALEANLDRFAAGWGGSIGG